MLSFCFPGRHPVTEVGGGQPKNLRVESVGRKEIASVFPWFFCIPKTIQVSNSFLLDLWRPKLVCTVKHPQVSTSLRICSPIMVWHSALHWNWWEAELALWLYCGKYSRRFFPGIYYFFPACILEFYVNTRPWDEHFMETGSFMYVLGWAGPLTIANTVLVFRKLSRICVCVIANGVPHILTKQVTVQVLEG